MVPLDSRLSPKIRLYSNTAKRSADDTQAISYLINTIADQTNLLGLNAAIEATRAKWKSNFLLLGVQSFLNHQYLIQRPLPIQTTDF